MFSLALSSDLLYGYCMNLRQLRILVNNLEPTNQAIEAFTSSALFHSKPLPRELVTMIRQELHMNLMLEEWTDWLDDNIKPVVMDEDRHDEGCKCWLDNYPTETWDIMFGMFDVCAGGPSVLNLEDEFDDDDDDVAHLTASREFGAENYEEIDAKVKDYVEGFGLEIVTSCQTLQGSSYMYGQWVQDTPIWVGIPAPHTSSWFSPFYNHGMVGQTEREKYRHRGQRLVKTADHITGQTEADITYINPQTLVELAAENRDKLLGFLTSAGVAPYTPDGFTAVGLNEKKINRRNNEPHWMMVNKHAPWRQMFS